MAGVASPTSRSFGLSPSLARLGEARHFVSDAAREAGFPEARVFDISVASSEAMANAIEHASGRKKIAVETRLFNDRLEVSVQGTGRFEMPDHSAKREHRGLGLPLMAKLSDHLALYSAPHGGRSLRSRFTGKAMRTPRSSPRSPRRCSNWWRAPTGWNLSSTRCLAPSASSTEPPAGSISTRRPFASTAARPALCSGAPSPRAGPTSSKPALRA